eukprot:8473044-Pyramimonas_sp.AAC.1
MPLHDSFQEVQASIARPLVEPKIEELRLDAAGTLAPVYASPAAAKAGSPKERKVTALNHSGWTANC